MIYEQISLLDGFQNFEMYDGYEVMHTVNILAPNGKEKLKKGQLYYLVSSYSEEYTIALPNEYGGSYGFTVNEKQFKEHFRFINRKVYPKSEEVWNGKSWIKNPSM